MRAYVIDSKEQDISYIPVNSFVYHDGCGFIKRKHTTNIWNDTDFERIYCTTNEELNPVIQSPDDGVLMKDACCLRFVVSGAFDFEKGATITEISFKDILGNPILYDETNFSDITLSNGSSWENETEWGFRNLFNGDFAYTDVESGPNSSTIFNLGMENYMDESEFHISLTPQQMEVLDYIELTAGSPEGRVPQSIAVYAVFDKDIPETKRETLIFLRTFTSEVDGMRPAKSTKITQAVNPSDPCQDLFLNGMNENGNYLVMNGNTGLLKSIYCEFPEVFKANGTDEQNNLLCEKAPNSLIVLDDGNGHITQLSISDYFKSIGWICEFKGCEGLTNTNYASCIKKACEAKKRNEATVVKYIDNNFNFIEMNIVDYLASKNAVCENLLPIIAVDTTPTNIIIVDITYGAYLLAVENGSVGSYEDWLAGLFEAGNYDLLTFNEWKSLQVAAQEAYEATLEDLDKLIENTGHGTDGLITTINPATGDTVTMTAAEYKQIIGAPIPTPVLAALSIDTIYGAEGDDTNITPETAPVIEIDNVTNMDINNLVIMDDLNAISYHFEEEVIMIPMFDAFGEPIVDENGFIVEEPKNVIKVIIDEINLPEGMDFGMDFVDIKITISDGTTSQTINLSVRDDGLSITEFKNINGTYTKPLKHIKDRNYQKKFEWDEAGLAIQYYGAKGPMTVSNISDKFEVTINPSGRSGVIIIKSLFNSEDIQHIEKENIIISDGYREFNVELYVTSHIRLVNRESIVGNVYNLGLHELSDGSFTIPVFNADANPLVFTYCQFKSYKRPSEKCMSTCNEYFGTSAKLIPNPNNIDDFDKYLIQFNPHTQNLNGMTFNIIDPYFNFVNEAENIIDLEDIVDTKVKLTINKLMTITRNEITINKYRFHHSKNNFTHEYKCWDNDFKLYNQANGLNLIIDNPNIAGVDYVDDCNGEDPYWKCNHGGVKPKKFRILTGEAYNDLGTTNFKFYDIDSEVNISVTTIQNLDIVLEWNKSDKVYNLENAMVGGQMTVQLLHPWDNDWSKVRAWSTDDSKCTTSINTDTHELVIEYHTIGEAFVYVTDGVATHKIFATSTYGTQFTAAFTSISIIDTDDQWYYMDLVNVQGTVSMGEFNTNIIEAEVIDNSSVRLRNIAGEGVFDVNTTIPLTDAQGNVTSGIKVNILDHNKWFTTNYLYPIGENGELGELSFDIPDAGSWTVTDSPEGVEDWISSNGKLNISTILSGTHLIELTHTDGTIKHVNVYVRPVWVMDESPIIFDNNEYTTNGD